MESFIQETAPTESPESIESLREQLAELKAVLEEERAEHKKQIEYLEKKAGIDYLTGVSNRAAFEAELGQAFEMLQGKIVEHREGAELLKEISLIFIDLDNFKQVNDTRGHTAGDEVLKKVVELLNGVLRESDMLARYGGDEFVALLPDTNEPGAMTTAEKLRTILENDPELKELEVSASFGVAWADASNATEPKILIEQADSAVYAAKQGGRNRVEVYARNS
jgi:diguanylate cyclase (GGDEF)-like protein